MEAINFTTFNELEIKSPSQHVHIKSSKELTTAEKKEFAAFKNAESACRQLLAGRDLPFVADTRGKKSLWINHLLVATVERGDERAQWDAAKLSQALGKEVATDDLRQMEEDAARAYRQTWV